MEWLLNGILIVESNDWWMGCIMLKGMIVECDVDCWLEWLLNGSWLLNGMLIVEMNNCWMECSLLNAVIVECIVDCWM